MQTSQETRLQKPSSDQERQQKLYEAQKKNIEYQMKIHGNTYELLRANDANEKAYYEAMEKNRMGWMDTYDDIVDGITEYVKQAHRSQE